MLELALVALYRPGWFVPNSADVVKANALQQKEDLVKNFFSKFKKEVRAAVWLASWRGRSISATPLANACPTCDALLDTQARVRAHLHGVRDSRGRSACERFEARVQAERCETSFWIQRLDRAIDVLLPGSPPSRRYNLARALHHAIRAYDFDPATAALRVAAEVEFGTNADRRDREGSTEQEQDGETPLSQVGQAFGVPFEELTTPPEEPLLEEERRNEQRHLEERIGERTEAHQAVEERCKKRPRRESISGTAGWTREEHDLRGDPHGWDLCTDAIETATAELVFGHADASRSGDL